MPDNKFPEDVATSGKPIAYRDDNENEPEFVEVDPTARYGRYNEILGKGAFKTVYPHGRFLSLEFLFHVWPEGHHACHSSLGLSLTFLSYRAFDEVDGIEVAWNQVKVQDVLQSPDDLERLYSEVHLLKTLKHKNIIKFYNSWIDTKTKNVNFITEIFTSGTLRQYRKKHKHVDLKAVKSWARQILRGLLYLHSHDPPIIHRDLKCDNIFVNGNQGEVKIGDLGLATILRQAHAAHSVIGTPEFMAPELYEEEYNELVDIYSFGMCVLEMVTFEYPYSECANAAQIYKKVTSGKKPAALEKVKDPEVRSFVEKCLTAASRRLPARELLMDPFLHSDGDRETLDLLPSRRLQTRTDDMEELGTLLEGQHRSNAIEGSDLLVSGIQDRGKMFKGSLPRLDLGSSVDKDSIAEDEVAHNHNESLPLTKTSPFSSSRDERSRRSRDFRVKGKRREDDTIFLRLRIGDHQGHFRNIHFPFDIEADSALSVASEMVAELDLSDQDVTTIAEMIDAEILALVPDWKPGAAFDDSVGIDGENLPDSPSDGFLTPQTNKNVLHNTFPTESLSESPPINDKPCSKSPVQLPLLTAAASPARGEYTVHGRFEEVSYRSCASDHSFQSEEFPAFSSDFSDAQEVEDDETLNGGLSHPGSPNSDAYGSSTEPPHPHALVQVGGGLNNMDMQPGVAMDELSNFGLHEAIHEHCETVKMNVGQGGHALNMTASGDRCESLNCPESEEMLDREVLVEHKIDESFPFSGVELESDDAMEDSVAEELRTLAVRQEHELRELQHKHELAVLEIQKRSRHKCSSSLFQASVEGQERVCIARKVNGSPAKCMDNWFPLCELGGNHHDFLNSASSGQDGLSESYSGGLEESLMASLGNNFFEKPDTVDTSEEMEASSSTQERVNLEVEQPQSRNESSCTLKEKYDLEYASSASEHEHQNESGCSHILFKNLSVDKLTCTASSQLSETSSCQGIKAKSDEECPMGLLMRSDSKRLSCDVMEYLLAQSNHLMPTELTAREATLETKHETEKVESLGHNRSGSSVEYYKAGGFERDKSFVLRGGFKGLDAPQDCESNFKAASINSTEAGRLEHQKKEQLQKSIAELEARTLQSLHSSQTRYSVNCAKKNLGGPTYVGQMALSKSQVRQQNAAELNKA